MAFKSSIISPYPVGMFDEDDEKRYAEELVRDAHLMFVGLPRAQSSWVKERWMHDKQGWWVPHHLWGYHKPDERPIRNSFLRAGQ